MLRDFLNLCNEEQLDINVKIVGKRLYLPPVQMEQEDGKIPTIYPQIIETYNNFIIERTGFPAKMDATEGKSAKRIIAYLTKASNKKDEAGCLEVWIYILVNWDKLTEFHQNRLKLSEINSDIVKILGQIKNSKQKGLPEKGKISEIISVHEQAINDIKNRASEAGDTRAIG
jgi:hypothetical protein